MGLGTTFSSGCGNSSHLTHKILLGYLIAFKVCFNICLMTPERKLDGSNMSGTFQFGRNEQRKKVMFFLFLVHLVDFASKLAWNHTLMRVWKHVTLWLQNSLRAPHTFKTVLNTHLMSLETKRGGFSVCVCRTFQHERNDRHRKKDKNFRILSPYYGRFWHMRPGSRFWSKCAWNNSFQNALQKVLLWSQNTLVAPQDVSKDV